MLLSEPNLGGVLAVACGVHARCTTDLPISSMSCCRSGGAEFALSYAALGVLRMLFAGAMAGLQLPMSLLGKRIGGPLLLALGCA